MTAAMNVDWKTTAGKATTAMAAVTGPPAVDAYATRVTNYVAPAASVYTAVGSDLATKAGAV